MDLADPPTPMDLIGRQPYRLTGADVTRMVAAGILHEDDRMELWNGQLIRISPRGPLHAKMLETLIDLLTTRKPLGTAVRIQDPIALGTYDQPEPDLALVNRDREASDRSHPRPQDIHLIIEVSDTTLRDDLGPKARLYAEAEIR